MYESGILGDIAKEAREIIFENEAYSNILNRGQLESYVSKGVKRLGDDFSKNYLRQGALNCEDLDEIALRLEKKACLKAELNPETNSGLIYRVQKR